MQDIKKLKYIRDFGRRYMIGSVLGHGAFGTVRMCQHRDTRKTCAVKIISKKSVARRKIYLDLLVNELSILAEKAHPRIVRIVELIEDDENYYIVSEVLKGGELFKRIIEAKCFTEQQASIIIKQVMEGLNYMHQQMVTHRDLKPENILLVSDNPYDLSVRIADLGFAQKFEKD